MPEGETLHLVVARRGNDKMMRGARFKNDYRLPSTLRLVTSDKLIGHIIEVFADDLRLRTDPQDIIANTFDQCSLPAGRDRA